MLVSCENYLTDPPSLQLKVGEVPSLGRGAGASVPTLVTRWPLVWLDVGVGWSRAHSPDLTRALHSPQSPPAPDIPLFQGEGCQHVIIL